MSDRELAHVHGRFQPFHIEHLEYTAWAAAGADELLVGITNADPGHIRPEEADSRRHDPEHNPFRYHERHRMVRETIDAAEIDCPVRIVPFPINRPELWEHYAPADAVHYVNVLEEWHRVKAQRLEEYGRSVVTKNGTRTVSGTDIRRRMASDDPWKRDVPDAVIGVIKQIEGVKRVQALFEKGG
jgi:nicotinamide-nucleotide adenylyltransferase